MNDDFDSTFDLDSILAEFDGSAPQEEAPSAPPAAAEELPPQPVSEPEAREEKPTEGTPRRQSQERATARPVREPKPVRAPVSAAPAPEPQEAAPRAGLITLLFGLLAALILLWALFNIHPASGTLSNASGSSSLSLSDKLDVYVNNAASDALGELAYIKKIYTLQENDTVSPMPNPANFGTTNDPADIREVIKNAADLLDGQSVIFDENADFVPGEPIQYYLDDTILVITWKEYINQRCCTCAEVKVAHGSQLRRKLAEDSYSSSVQLYASDMAKQANAVVAINGDFYAFRDLGITVYQCTLYRNSPAKVDSCFFTSTGDMLFTRAGELTGEGETQKFIEDNDVVFAIAFGPVLVDNGELQYCERYPIGEIDTEYSRSCIGMYDELHYFLMTINHTTDARPRATVNELARFVYSKGVQKAYNLDGGQTSEIIMNGEPINHIDFGFERTVSDIIYFATAIPNEEASK